MVTKPSWLKVRLNHDSGKTEVNKILNNNNVNTVCREACCPNLNECYKEGTATFMIMGDRCTRGCSFCAVRKGPPYEKLDPMEAERIALTAKQLNLTHVVITSVTRDDIYDGGAWLFALVIEKIKEYIPGATVEVLIPDFAGDKKALQKVLEAEPDVINHNLETVPSLYLKARPQANYKRSLNLLKEVKKQSPNIRTKSGLMVGLGEEIDEIIETGKDLRSVGCDLLTVGQYLSPSLDHYPVYSYYTPEEFKVIKEHLEELGFSNVMSGPLVRSSYKAYSVIKKCEETN